MFILGFLHEDINCISFVLMGLWCPSRSPRCRPVNREFSPPFANSASNVIKTFIPFCIYPVEIYLSVVKGGGGWVVFFSDPSIHQPPKENWVLGERRWGENIFNSCPKGTAFSLGRPSPPHGALKISTPSSKNILNISFSLKPNFHHSLGSESKSCPFLRYFLFYQSFKWYLFWLCYVSMHSILSMLCKFVVFSWANVYCELAIALTYLINYLNCLRGQINK